MDAYEARFIKQGEEIRAKRRAGNNALHEADRDVRERSKKDYGQGHDMKQLGEGQPYPKPKE